MKRRPTAADGSKLERRKVTRFPVTIPLGVSWKGADGVPMSEEAVARQVNDHGGLLEMANYPDLGSRVMLTNLLSADTMEARVLATPNSREGVSQGIVVELVSADESFWGVNLHVGKPVPSNKEGHLISHVIDRGETLADPKQGGTYTNETLRYHVDESDFVALVCLHPAKLSLRRCSKDGKATSNVTKLWTRGSLASACDAP